jgi:phage baseplate assembly protein V
MIRFGKIAEVDADRCLVRVEFDDDGLVTGFLPVLQPKTQKDKFYYVPDPDEHVACLMDEHAENGVVLGAIYSEAETPGATKGADKVGVAYESGDAIEYDRAAQRLRVKTGETEFVVAKEGPTVKKGGESLKAILSDLIDAILSETHPTGTGPSGTPINAAQYNDIKTRVSNFFEA